VLLHGAPLIHVSWPCLRKHYPTVINLGAHTGRGFSAPFWLYFLHVLPDKHTLITISEIFYILNHRRNGSAYTANPNYMGAHFLIIDPLILAIFSKSDKLSTAMAS
jgi:hypothetical protein